MSSLNVAGVNFIYQSDDANEDIIALQDVNLEIRDKAFVVVIGASGCGKTTLLNLLAGFLRPSSGRIFFAADNTTGEEEQEITSPGSDRGVVFQRHALLPWLNVLDNVAFGLKLQGVEKAERLATAARYLELVGLEDFHTNKIYQLSGGMQQRVGIARTLTANPSCLLMDEPLGALDALTREKTQELLLKVWEETGKKIFFITHSVEEAIFMATDIIVMSPRPGRITHKFELDFCRRFLELRDSRKIKSLPEFIEMREKVLQIIYSDEEGA